MNVLPAFRGKGIATRLLRRAEGEIACRSDIIGIGVGLHPGYNDAQRLYGKRGYVPDGGPSPIVTTVRGSDQVVLDDNLPLHLTRRVRSLSRLELSQKRSAPFAHDNDQTPSQL